MKVLSLFNGISCGRIALERAGIPIDRYVSFEIDKYANQIAKKNYPNDEYNGDVFEADFTQYKGFDILIGGSPCTSWSIAKQGRETTSSGIGWELFMQYKRALTESGCRYFLYENNYSIHKDIQAAISEELGVESIMINSALVSAQQRRRLYWTNIPDIEQPIDKGIFLKDILDSGFANREKGYCLDAHYHKTMGNTDNMITGNHARNNRTIAFEPFTDKEKAYTLTATYANSVPQDMLKKKRTQVFEPIRIGNMGDTIHNKQGYRVYSVQGKSVCLSSNGSGVGGKTGLYYIDLPDGDYIIRKLTPVECERLQTLPDGYTEGVSNTQRYKGLGNGWTVDVIVHIFKHIAINAERKSA